MGTASSALIRLKGVHGNASGQTEQQLLILGVVVLHKKKRPKIKIEFYRDLLDK